MNLCKNAVISWKLVDLVQLKIWLDKGIDWSTEKWIDNKYEYILFDEGDEKIIFLSFRFKSIFLNFSILFGRLFPIINDGT